MKKLEAARPALEEAERALQVSITNFYKTVLFRNNGVVVKGQLCNMDGPYSVNKQINSFL